MQDKPIHPAFAEALSQIELDFFRAGDDLDAPVSAEIWDNLSSAVHTTAAAEPEEDDWEWAIAIARARATTAH